MPSEVARHLLRKKPGVHVVIAMGPAHHDGGSGMFGHDMHDGMNDPGLGGHDGADEQQHAYEQVTEGLQTLASEHPEAKALLKRFEALHAKWIGGHAKAAASAPDLGPAGPDDEANEPMPDNEEAEGESSDGGEGT